VQSFGICVVITGQFDAITCVNGSPAMVKAVAWSGEIVASSKGCGFERDVDAVGFLGERLREEPVLTFGNSAPSCPSNCASCSGLSAATCDAPSFGRQSTRSTNDNHL
jgi:hypothetical protein